MFLGYYDVKRDGTRVLSRDIGPVSFPRLGVNDTILAGSNLTANSEWKVYILAYGYSFYKTDTLEITGKVGANVAKISTTLSGTLITANNGTASGSTAGSDFTAPLPVIGLSADWALTDRWRLKGSLGGFKAKAGDVEATVTEAGIAVDYRLFRNFGIGGGYNLLRVNADVNKSNVSGSLDWRSGGLMIYGSLVF